MTEPNGWLDMSQFPDDDPDTVLTVDQHGLLTAALTVDDTEVPDAVWEHMLATVIGSTDDVEPAAEDPGPVDTADDPADDPTWTADLEHGLFDTADDDDATDPAGEHDHDADHHAGDHGGGEDVAP